MSVAAPLPENNKLSGAGLPWKLHEACVIWPDLSPADLRDLSDDIAANGLRDPVTLTPDDLLLDGKNRALACIMAGIDPAATAVVHDGDPWLFSTSRDKHRRHLNTDQLALVLAALAKRNEGAPAGNRNAAKTTGPSGPVVSDDERPTIAQLAEEGGISKTIVKSAKVVLEHGTEQEKDNVRAGRVKVRKTADAIRNRRRALTPPATPKPTPKPAEPATPTVDPIDAVVCDIIAKCSDGKWRTTAKFAAVVKRTETSIREALKSLGDCVAQRKNENGEIEYRIERGGEALLRRTVAAKDVEIADRDREIVSLKNQIAEKDAEIERLTELLTTPPRPTASPKKASVSKH